MNKCYSINRELYKSIPLTNERVTLCGSTRYRDQFDFWNTHLTLAGNVVYSVAVDAHASVDTQQPTDYEKRILDDVHLRKIQNSDAIFVIDINGYIGFSTAREVAFAHKMNKKIYYLSLLYPELAFKNSVA